MSGQENAQAGIPEPWTEMMDFIKDKESYKDIPQASKDLLQTAQVKMHMAMIMGREDRCTPAFASLLQTICDVSAYHGVTLQDIELWFRKANPQMPLIWLEADAEDAPPGVTMRYLPDRTAPPQYHMRVHVHPGWFVKQLLGKKDQTYASNFERLATTGFLVADDLKGEKEHM